MSNKQQRTAWNLTKTANALGIERVTDHGFTPLYEIARDNKIACIELKTFDLDGGIVFVPGKEWKEAYEDRKLREGAGFFDPEWPQVRLARKYRDDAMKHQF